MENRPQATGPGGPAGRRAVELPERFSAVLDDYAAALGEVPLSANTRRTYASKVRHYLLWLGGYAAKSDPLGEKAAWDWAVRDHHAPSNPG